MSTDDLPIPTTDDPGPLGGAGREPPLRVRLSDPGDLVAAIPPLIGFCPTDSMVLVAMLPGRGPTPFRVGAVVRADLPEPDDGPAVVAACVRRMGVQCPAQVTLVVVGGEGPSTPSPRALPPRADLVDEVEKLCAAVRLPVHARLWVPRIVDGARWRCYPPCDCRGSVPSPQTSRVATAATLLGQVTYASRDEMDASLAPRAGADGPRMRGLIDAAAEAARLDRELAGPSAALRDLRAVESGVAEVAAGVVLGDPELGRIAVALRDPHVRDTCLAWALQSRAGPAEELWTTLVRTIPAPEVAEPAVLLAFSVFVRGGGALVGAALERALRAEPHHRLSGLFSALLAQGVDQTEVRDMLAGAGAAARERVGQ